MPVYSTGSGWVDLGHSYTFTSTSTTNDYVIWPTTGTTTWGTAANWTVTYQDPIREAVDGWNRPDPPVEYNSGWGSRRTSQDRIVATDRAEELLFSLLTDEQAESYRRDGSFVVIGSHGGRYRITRGVSGNILWLPEGSEQPYARLCAHPTMAESWLPTPDVQVAQLLALITDEREFVNRANIHSGRYPTHLAAA